MLLVGYAAVITVALSLKLVLGGKKKTELSSSGKYSTCMYLGMRKQWGTEIDKYVFHLSVLSVSGVLSPLVLVI